MKTLIDELEPADLEDPIFACFETQKRLLALCIALLEICSQIGLSLFRVAENGKRSIRDNIRLIIDHLVLAPSTPYYDGLVSMIFDAADDLLHVDKYITEHTAGDRGDNITETRPAVAVQDAAIEALRAVLYCQAKNWDRENVEDLRQIRIDLCRLGIPDARLGTTTYDVMDGLEIVGQDDSGRRLAVVILDE